MQIIFVSYLNQVVQLQIELGEHVSSYVTADIPSPLLPCSLVRFFFAGIAILGCFLAQPFSPGFTGVSFSRRGGLKRLH